MTAATISKTPTGNYKGVFTSQPIDTVVDAINNLQGNGTPVPIYGAGVNGTGPNSLTGANTIGGTLVVTPQLIASAGATQGGATAITSLKAIVTVSATVSTKGVKLPAASTGLEVEVANAGAFSCNVYPFAGGKIGAASTNAADSTKLLINKANRYIAVNTTLWVVQRGA